MSEDRRATAAVGVAPAATLVAAAGLVAAIVAVAGPPADADAYVAGPPPAHTGGFDEPTCRACHFDAELNASGGALELEGVPAEYAPGDSYRLTVTLAREGLALGGFQLAARFAEGAGAAGEQAGVLEPFDDGRVEVVRLERNGIHYAQHREAGTEPVAPDSARWTVEWIAPETAAGDVVFHLTANAANDDFSEFGDYIHAATRTSRAP